MRIIAFLAVGVVLATPMLADAQEAGSVGGRVVDAVSGEPVEGVIVRIRDLAPVLSDDRGIFVLPQVPAGSWQIRFEHIGYGTHERAVEVAGGAETVLVVEISTAAIELRPVVVETLSELERRRITSGYSINEIGPAEIAMAARAGLTFGDLVGGSLPGVDVRPGGAASLCVTYRAIRTDNDRSDCDGVSVIVDGVPVADPRYVYSALPLQDIHRIEVLSPAQAGVRYGMRGGQGALLVETKRGPARRRSNVDRYLTGLDWSGESEPYPWLEVYGASVLVNAAALGLTYWMADRCFRTQEASLALRTRCGPLATAGSGVLSIALPAGGGGLAARWVGTTDRSRGRLVPAVVAGGMVLSAGYILLLAGEGNTEFAGGVVLTLGVPAVLTLADRIIRIRR